MIASSDERPLIKITSSATPNRARFFFKSLMMFLLDQLKGLTTEEMSRHVDAQIVELTWLIGHFFLLNR